MFPQEQIDALKRLCPNIRQAEEGGTTFILLPDLKTPAGCSPDTVDALLCPTPRDGYSSRLFFDRQIQSPQQRNWNGQVTLFERVWYAISWQIEAPNLTLVQKLQVHLSAFQ